MNNKKISPTDRLKIANEIKKLYSEGFLVVQIQKKLNLSNKLYYTICNEYNISSPNKIIPFKPSTQIIEEIKELFAKKCSGSEIARRLNITEKILDRVIKKNNIERSTLATEDENIITLVKELFESGSTISNTSRKLNISKSSIRKIYENLKLDAKENLKRGQNPIPTEKQCKNSNCIIKPISEFFKTIRKNGFTHYSSYCIKCANEIAKVNNKKYKDKRKKDTPEQKNRRKERARQRYHEDIEFRLRSRMSAEIRRGLKKNNSSKNGHSFLKYIPYSMMELREHIELYFKEPGNEWMTWENWGVYDPKIWDDNDKSTWTWNLDHINPQSDLPYTSMKDKNFKECWALSNLRPYSAKQNIIDGTTKIRHNKT